MARVAALREAGASVAGAWGGGRVLAAQGTGSTVLCVVGGGRGHEMAAAWPCGVVAAPQGAGAARVSG